MSYWIDSSTGQPVDEAAIRAEHPRTVFPSPFAPHPERYTAVPVQPEPEYDPATHHAELQPPEQVDGEWVQQWVVTAYTPEELEAQRQALVPASVTRRQARQALLLAGLLDNVQPAIDAIPDATTRGMAQIEWDDSQMFERHRPLLIQLGTALGLDDAALDNLFIEAAAL